jgi:hypothetical protein
MRCEKYDSQHYPALAAAARELNIAALLRKDFVDYYYQSQPWSELYLALEEDGSCVAFIGFDRLRFECDGQELSIGMATNFYTLKPGMGGFLWLQWMKNCGLGIVFGGSEDTHRILKKQHFTYYQGINMYSMNGRFSEYGGESPWRKYSKRVLRALTRKPLKEYETGTFKSESASITAKEISSCYGSPFETSCFRFRFAPTKEYLRWRYNSELQFVRYRWFDIFDNGKRSGCCILNDAPGHLIVSYSDGLNPGRLAYGIMKSLFLVAQGDERQRSALLASSHPEMQKVFIRHGFTVDVASRPMAIGSLRSTIELPNPQSWLINYGIGDNDLRASTFHP